jgi:hypothetical protein
VYRYSYVFSKYTDIGSVFSCRKSYTLGEETELKIIFKLTIPVVTIISTSLYGHGIKSNEVGPYIKTTTFWNVKPHNLVDIYQCFGSICCLSPQGRRV